MLIGMNSARRSTKVLTEGGDWEELYADLSGFADRVCLLRHKVRRTLWNGSGGQGLFTSGLVVARRNKDLSRLVRCVDELYFGTGDQRITTRYRGYCPEPEASSCGRLVVLDRQSTTAGGLTHQDECQTVVR